MTNNFNFFNNKMNLKYSNNIKNRNFISNLLNFFLKNIDDNILLKHKKFLICGRVFGKRIMGKASFLDVRDFSGSLQLYLSKNNVLEIYDKFISTLNLGDIIQAYGNLFKTKTGEISLNVFKIAIISKNYNLFPDKYIGLLDKEICYRYRYLDLMINENSRNKFIIRSKIIFEIRKFFSKKGYLEVETPIMQNIIGGADARPFKTYHNYLNSDLFLRVSPELYLKRLIVGGFEKVFEIGKSFRNEGLSNRHNPEFTMIEFYQAYSNYKDLINITQKLFIYLSTKILNTCLLKYENNIIDLSKKFNQISFFDSIIYYTDFSYDQLFDKKFLISFFSKQNIIFEIDYEIIDFQLKLFEIFVEKKLIQPTFILYHPIEISPLSKFKNSNKKIVERFELYICGKEIANGFSELNDPNEQINRFLSQIYKKDNIDLKYDYDYINSLMYGLPPTAGEGIGIDRLIMLFTNSNSIKDVLFFPLMKKKNYDKIK